MKATKQQEFEFSTDHIATSDHVKKLGLMYVPHSKLKIEEDFNDRVDYGTKEEMNELAESIYTFGPRVPLKGYKDGEYYVILQGHRRFKAGEMIKEKYSKDIVFPFQSYAPGTTRKEMLLDTLLTNSGKDLTPLEKASTVSKLFAENMTVKDIASALGGVSQVYIKNLQKLWAVPEEAKKLIRDGVISATLLMGYLKSKDANIEEFIAQIKEQAGEETTEEKVGKTRKKKQAKVTAKKALKTKNSLQEVKTFIKWVGAKETETGKPAIVKGKEEVFELLTKIANNKASYKAIFDFFTSK